MLWGTDYWNYTTLTRVEYASVFNVGYRRESDVALFHDL